MARKAQTNLTNIWTFIAIIFSVILFVIMLQTLGSDALNNEHTTLGSESTTYILKSYGITNQTNLSKYTNMTIDELLADTTNQSSGAQKDYALEFLYGYQQGGIIRQIITNIYAVPTIIITTFFNLNINDWRWFLGMLDFLWFCSIFIAIYYFIRAVVTQK